ncbi:MAG TPA: PAS domain S-box protein, partial [Bryobacteraceae bacterium]
HAQEALRESERRFRTLSSLAPVGIFLTDLDGNCLLVNERWSEMAGVPLTEAKGGGCLHAVHPDDRERVLEDWREAALAGTEFSSEFRIPKPRGAVTWVQGSAVALHGEGGEVQGYIGTITDITAQIKAQEELLQTKRQLANILDSITEAFVALDRNWRFTFANRQAIERLGLPLDQILGKSLWELLPEAMDTDFYPRYTQVMQDRVPVHFELKYPNGHWLEVFAHPTEEGLAALVLDITLRKEMEQAIERSERRFRALIENTTDGIMVVGREGKILFSGRPILGHVPEEWMGKSAFDLLHPDDQEQAMSQIAGLAATPGDVLMAQYRTRHQDGSWRWVDVVVKNLLDDPDVRGIVINYRDITERKQLEEQLRQTQKLESLGVLAGGIAHDFNNLLVGILGNSSMALETLPQFHHARPMLQDIAAAADRAANLTRQMLAYSGKGKFIIEAVQLSELVREMIGLLRTSIPRHVELRQELADSLPAIEADVGQIQQLVMNFVINGAESTGDQQGAVCVRTGVQEIDAPYARTLVTGRDIEPGTYVYLEVADTGTGMETSTVEKIFDPFFTTKAAGRGLGLAAALGIVRGHRGAIAIESVRGKGSTFRVLFPVSEAPIARHIPPKPEADLRGQGTVLVVDDEEIVRRLAQVALERRGYRVIVAENGRDALEVCAANPDTSVVLLDLSMPVMAGEDCLRELHAIRPGLPVILSSGYTEADAIHRFAGKGLAGFLQKPYTSLDLAVIVKSVVAQGSGLRVPPPADRRT